MPFVVVSLSGAGGLSAGGSDGRTVWAAEDARECRRVFHLTRRRAHYSQ